MYQCALLLLGSNFNVHVYDIQCFAQAKLKRIQTLKTIIVHLLMNAHVHVTESYNKQVHMTFNAHETSIYHNILLLSLCA